LITNKFNYKPLPRESIEGRRHYCLPDGSRVASVTSILDATQSEEKKAGLARWRKSVGEEKAREITTEAASRGTRMHKWLEDFILTDDLGKPGSNPYSQQSFKMAKCVVEKGLINVNEFWGVEVPLYFPGLYAGTSDGCGIHLNDEAILDYKQTNKPKKEEWIEDYFIQLVAYALAHNEVHGTNIRKGVVLMCVKPPEIEPGLWGEPQYQEFILKPKDFDYWENKWWERVEKYYKNI